jgi:hypothetical protein
MHAYKKKDANPQKGIDSQGISIEKTGYCRGNFSLDVSLCGNQFLCRDQALFKLHRTDYPNMERNLLCL